jgi:hypothetical protein
VLSIKSCSTRSTPLACGALAHSGPRPDGETFRQCRIWTFSTPYLQNS